MSKSKQPPPKTAPALPEPASLAASHAEYSRVGFRRSLAATVALGCELVRLQKELGATPGRPENNQSTSEKVQKLHLFGASWKDFSAQITGYSYRWVSEVMSTARECRSRLGKGRTPLMKGACKLLDRRGKLWSDEDYDTLAEALKKRFSGADSMSHLAGELGLLAAGPRLLGGSAPISPAGSDDPPDDQGQESHDLVAIEIQMAFDFFGEPLNSMSQRRAEWDTYLRSLKTLPVEDFHDPRDGQHKPGLRTMRTQIQIYLDDLDQVLSEKAKPAKSTG